MLDDLFAFFPSLMNTVDMDLFKIQVHLFDFKLFCFLNILKVQIYSYRSNYNLKDSWIIC